MELKSAITQRRSIRGFTDKAISKETLTEVLHLATRAVSAVNCQPWEFAVVTGEVLQAIAKDNMDCLEKGIPGNMKGDAEEGIYRTRRVDVAKQLFSAMSIAREDREKRNWWGARGYRFFDAPAVILLFMDRILEGDVYHFDLGCVTQNICLAALEYGLGTCVEYQAVAYERGLRKYLNIPESKEAVCGIAIGYPDPDFPANHVITQRESLENNTAWYGF